MAAGRRPGVKRIVGLILLSVLLGLGGLMLAAGGALFDRSLWVPPPQRGGWWVAALAFALAGWFLPAWKIRALATPQGVRLRLLHAWYVHVSGVFGTAMTPSGTGGGPAMVMALYRYGVPYGRGMGVAVQFFVLDLTAFAAIIPFGLAYLVWGSGIRVPLGLEVLALATAVVATAAAVFLGRYPRPVVRLALWASRRALLARFRSQLRKSARDYYRASRGFARMPAPRVALLLALSASVWLANFLLFWVLLRAFALPASAGEIVALLSVLTLGSFVVPTPGASGFMEFVTSLAFGDRAGGSSPAGPILYWRMITFYVVYLLGPAISWLIVLDRPPRWLRRRAPWFRPRR